MSGDGQLHANHRQRLKNRFLKEGLDHFEKHNVLELLLFFCIPRVDTNELAHRLLQRFGSITNVLTASREELCSVDGVGENTALFLRLFGELRVVMLNETAEERITLGDTARIEEYLVGIYTGLREETVFVLYFNAKEQLICAEKLFTGSVSSCVMRKRQIVEKGLSVGASFFILAHNHPNGIAAPSDEDMRVTRSMSHLFRELEMPLADHYIVGDGKACSLRAWRQNTQT